jgi:hypothetical protein
VSQKDNFIIFFDQYLEQIEEKFNEEQKRSMDTIGKGKRLYCKNKTNIK